MLLRQSNLQNRENPHEAQCLKSSIEDLSNYGCGIVAKAQGE